MKQITGKIDKINKLENFDELIVGNNKSLFLHKEIGKFNVERDSFYEGELVNVTLNNLGEIIKIENLLEETHKLSDTQVKSGKSKGTIKGDPVVCFGKT